MKFTEMLRARWRNADTLLCVVSTPIWHAFLKN